MEICSICMDTVFLPVEMTSFSCFCENKIHCCSLIRTCRLCTFDFLQLNKDITDRDFVKKCLYCPGVCHPRFITPYSSFRKDFILMKNDKNIYNCPFCTVFIGTQIEIDKHIDYFCPNTPIQCDCGKVILKNKLSEHENNCLYYTKCEICSINVKKYDLKQHLIHLHNLMECYHCKKFILKPLMPDHIIFTCSERIEKCKICKADFPHYDIHDHHMSHLKNLEDRILIQKKKLNSLLQEYKNMKMTINESFLLLE